MALKVATIMANQVLIKLAGSRSSCNYSSMRVRLATPTYPTLEAALAQTDAVLARPQGQSEETGRAEASGDPHTELPST
jgi:hypothetical protein